jgi:hypothetical protein
MVNVNASCCIYANKDLGLKAALSPPKVIRRTSMRTHGDRQAREPEKTISH